MERIRIENVLDDGNADHTLRIVFQVPVDLQLVDDIWTYFENGNPLPEDVYKYITDDKIQKKIWKKPPQELYEMDFYSKDKLGMWDPSDKFEFEYDNFNDYYLFYEYVVPYDPEKLKNFYSIVRIPRTKYFYKTASALLKRTNGDIEAAAQMLAKMKF